MFDLQVVIELGFLVFRYAFGLFPENQVGYVSFCFLRWAESDHILRTGGRDEFDHLRRKLC